jgi:hypothetical protein
MEKMLSSSVYEAFASLLTGRKGRESVTDAESRLIERLCVLGFDFSRNYKFLGPEASALPALHAAVSFGDLPLVKCLVDFGADVNNVNTDFDDAVKFAMLCWRREKDVLRKECVLFLIKKRARLDVAALFTELEESAVEPEEYDLVAMICSKFVGCNLSDRWIERGPGNASTNATVFALHLRNIQTSYLTAEVCPGWSSDAFLSLQIHIFVIMWLKLRKSDANSAKLRDFLKTEINALRNTLMLEKDGHFVKELGAAFVCMKERIAELQDQLPFLIISTGWKRHCVHVEFKGVLGLVFNAGALSENQKRVPDDDSLDVFSFKCDNVPDFACSLLQLRWDGDEKAFEKLIYLGTESDLLPFKDDRNAPVQQKAGNCVVQSYIFGLAFRAEVVFVRAWSDLLNLMLTEVSRFERSDCHLQSRIYPLFAGAISLAEYRYPGHLCDFADVCRLSYDWPGSRIRNRMLPFQEVIFLMEGLKGSTFDSDNTFYRIAREILDAKDVLQFDDCRDDVIVTKGVSFSSGELDVTSPDRAFVFGLLKAMMCYRASVARIASRLFRWKDCERGLKECAQMLDLCLSNNIFLGSFSYLKSYILYYRGLVCFRMNDFRKAIGFVQVALSSFETTTPLCLPSKEHIISSLALMLVADNEPHLCLELLKKFEHEHVLKLDRVFGLVVPGADAPKFARDIANGLAHKLLGVSGSEGAFELAKKFLISAQNAFMHPEIDYHLKEIEKAISGGSMVQNHDAAADEFVARLGAIYGNSPPGRGVKRDRDDQDRLSN